MGAQRALGRPRRSHEELDSTLIALVDRVTGRLRRAHRVCRTVTMRMRFSDFTRATRSHSLPEATAQTHTLLAVARGLLAEAMPTIRDQGLTLLGISFGNLESDSVVQLALPLDRREAPALDAAVDSLRDRFGSGVVRRAVLLGREDRPAVPLLPD